MLLVGGGGTHTSKHNSIRQEMSMSLAIGAANGVGGTEVNNISTSSFELISNSEVMGIQAANHNADDPTKYDEIIVEEFEGDITLNQPAEFCDESQRATILMQRESEFNFADQKSSDSDLYNQNGTEGQDSKVKQVLNENLTTDLSANAEAVLEEIRNQFEDLQHPLI